MPNVALMKTIVLIGAALIIQCRVTSSQTSIESVEGPETFQANVRAAIALLAKQSPPDHGLVVRYIQTVKPGTLTKFAIGPQEPHVEISEYDAAAPKAWLAAVLVHEATHARLFAEHRWRRIIPFWDPPPSWKGLSAEIVCLDAQAKALVALGYDPSVSERVRLAWETRPYWIIRDPAPHSPS